MSSVQPNHVPNLWRTRQSEILSAFETSRKPLGCLGALSALADERITTLWAEVTRGLALPRCCLVATGGYGRRELYPHSDLDIMLLHDGPEEAFTQPLSRLLQALWDEKVKVGHACRGLTDCHTLMLEDQTIFTTLLDARHITGDAGLFRKLANEIKNAQQSIDKKHYLVAKLEERQARLAAYGRSQFLLEPNVKENTGALRDLHTLYWLARGIYGVRRTSGLVQLGVLREGEYRRFRRAHEFLATVRIRLHMLAGRADERLTFDRQQELAEWLDYRGQTANEPVERFMKQYFHHAKQLSQLVDLFTAILEDELIPPSAGFLSRLKDLTRSLDGFELHHRRLTFAPEMDLAKQSILMLKLFAIAQREQLAVHPRAARQITRHLRHITPALRQTAEANTLFMHILLHEHAPDDTLAQLNDCGLLGKFIPDFGYLVGQVQFDRYHVFTTDEHIIRLIGQLHQMQEGELKDELPLASEIIQQITSRPALFLAAFCHDIAKGRGGQHEQRGASIARKLAARFGLDSGETSLAAWLVSQHSLMSQTAFSRDLDDPQTLIDFCTEVQSPERLKCLLLLTVADIRAVGPGIWNGWKGSLLRDLFARAEAALGTPQRFSSSDETERLKAQIAPRLEDWPDTLRAKLLNEDAAGFWLGLPPEQHARIAGLLRQVWQGAPITSAFQTHSFDAITHLQLALPDHYALLHRLAGCITRIGGSIVGIRSVTLSDGTAVLCIDLQDKQGGAYERTTELKRLSALLKEALREPRQLAEAVARRRPKRTRRSKALERAPTVYLDNALSEAHTVIEVGATDRIGLLYDITGALTKLNLTILSSHITTYGEKAIDVFYVQDEWGHKIIAGDKITVIRESLLDMLTSAEQKTEG